MEYKEPPFPIGVKKTKVCLPAEKMRNRFGRMVYGHKTAGAIEVMTKECWDNNKKYFVPGASGTSGSSGSSGTSGSSGSSGTSGSSVLS